MDGHDRLIVTVFASVGGRASRVRDQRIGTGVVTNPGIGATW
jgi:hypothetical protein